MGKQTHQSLALLDVLFLEKELAVEIGEVYRVEVEESDVAKSCEDDVFHYISRMRKQRMDCRASETVSRLRKVYTHKVRTQYHLHPRGGPWFVEGD